MLAWEDDDDDVDDDGFLQVLVFVREWDLLGFLELLVVTFDCGLVDGDFGRGQGRGLDKDQVWISDEFSCEPEEGLLEVIVALCRNIVVLKILLAVERDLLGLDFSVHDVNLVSAENDGNGFAHPHDVPMPGGDVFVGGTRGNVEHDDSSLSLDVVSVSESSELFLSGCKKNNLSRDWRGGGYFAKENKSLVG